MTLEQQDEMIAAEIHSFEVQHFQFALQAQRQADILLDLPSGPWPAGIDYLKGKKRDEIIALAKSQADLDQAQQYTLRDTLFINQKSAELERGRVEGYHSKAVASIPVGRRVAALAAAKVKRDKEENARLGIRSV